MGAYLVDFAPSILASVPFYVGYVMLYVRFVRAVTSAPSDPSSYELFVPGPALWSMLVGLVLMITAIGWQWYNRWRTAGRTGQSLGKRMLGISLVAESTGQPIGPLNAFVRDLLHVLDGAVYVGYLWPLWDAKRQTFSDMIMKTVVVDTPAPATQAGPTTSPTGSTR